jgi:hypothetical protein
MASGRHDYNGGVPNALCMTQHSHAPPGASTGDHNGNRLYGMEYRNTGNIDKNHDHDAACAVCEYDQQDASIYTEWGRYGSCSTDGHVKVYEGVVMANYYHQRKGEHVCVDYAREAHEGNYPHHNNGGYLYTTEMEGGSAHEGWYPHNLEVGCTVCATPIKKAVYTRWGHKSCPTGSTKMYDGMIAGPHRHHAGGGYNYLCMTRHSHAPPGAYTHNNDGNLLYGVEYADTGAMNKNHMRDAACVVCQHDTASFTMVQWGRFGSCTNDMEKVYDGIVMADYYTYYASENICVDMEREYHEGEDGGHHWHGTLYTTEMEGGSSHESWYPHDLELGCTVCAPTDNGNGGDITADMCLPGFFFDDQKMNCVTETEICEYVRPAHSIVVPSGVIHEVADQLSREHTCSFECLEGYAWTGKECLHIEDTCLSVAPPMAAYTPIGEIAVTVTKDDLVHTCRFSSFQTGAYTHWGSRKCPTGHHRLYEGFMASSNYNDRGGGATTLCMTEHSAPPPGASTGNHNGNRLYGMEYHNTGNVDKNQDRDAACAVCAPPTKGSIYTEWGRFGSCSTEGHVKMYEGVVMSNYYTYKKADNVCVDLERGGHASDDNSNHDGGRLYTTEMEGGSSHEEWYPNNVELGCTVCQARKPVYTRWGSRNCPSGSTRMYEGFMASSHYSHNGGGVNSLCMTEHSFPPPGAYTHSNQGNLLYGMEYENSGTIDKNHDQDAACAVCEYDEQDAQIYTEWGRYGSCSTDGHVKVYEGLVMSTAYTEQKGENVCVDMERAAHHGNHYDEGHNHNGGRLYTTEMEGGSSHENWYPHNLEIGCTVCATPTDKAVYTRWGSRTCPDNSTKMYEGFMANAHYHHHGGGFNTLCMTEHSEPPPGASHGDNHGNRLYGMEYTNTGAIDKNHDRDAACVVCQHDEASYTFTQWGRFGNCSHGFNKLYDGLIMSNRYDYYKSDNLCVDIERAYHEGDSSSNNDGGALYTSEMESGASNEQWYPHDIELGCTVCGDGVAIDYEDSSIDLTVHNTSDSVASTAQTQTWFAAPENTNCQTHCESLGRQCENYNVPTDQAGLEAIVLEAGIYGGQGCSEWHTDYAQTDGAALVFWYRTIAETNERWGRCYASHGTLNDCVTTRNGNDDGNICKCV